MKKRILSPIGIVGILVSVLNTATMAQDLLTQTSPTTLNTLRLPLPKDGGRLAAYPTLQTPGPEAPVIEGKMRIAYTGAIILQQSVDMTEVTNDGLLISTPQLPYRDQEQINLRFEGDLWFDEYLWFDEGSEIANNSRRVMEDRDDDGKFEFLFIDKEAPFKFQLTVLRKPLVVVGC